VPLADLWILKMAGKKAAPDRICSNSDGSAPAGQ
jgi:hypothetical protein